MKLTLIFSVLLLCSFSLAELPPETGNDIIEGVGQDNDALKVSDQVDPQDNHAVLREMNSLLAAHTVELKNLQREREGQVSLITQLQELVQGQAIQIIQLQELIQAQETQLEELEQQGIQQRHQVEEETKEQTCPDVEDPGDETGNLLQVLNRSNVIRVAFTASLLSPDTGYVGPYSDYSILIFKKVFTNIGGAYSQYSGIFTAPVSGVYHFQFYVGAHGSGNPSSATLVKNGQRTVIAYEHQPSHFGSSANAVTLSLNAKDEVYLQVWPGTRIYDSINSHSTFSGHLLFTL